jgi:hypothetical protein
MGGGGADWLRKLDAYEFAVLLASPSLNLVLEPGQTAQLMEALDVDQNGTLDWQEFVPGFRALLARVVAANAAGFGVSEPGRYGFLRILTPGDLLSLPTRAGG